MVIRKSINIDHNFLSYLEKNEAGATTIFFIHGNSGSARTWNSQLNSSLLSSYRLIAIDLPGHGDSFRSEDPGKDYSPPATAKLLATTITILRQNKPFILVGFSYGTNLIAEMLQHEIRPDGICMIGMCCVGQLQPMNMVFKLESPPPVFFYNEKNKSVITCSIENMLVEKDNTTFLADDYQDTDPFFRLCLMQAAANGNVSDEIELLQNFQIPICVVFGVNDTLINIDYLQDSILMMWEKKIFQIEAAGHFVHLDKQEEVNRLIQVYANEQFTRCRDSLHN
ncbi:alpha/beta hydrolase [Flavisolibacter sp. BT320]|nr:alpha/beta hydrolase [Flavisolibacter longurius]